MLPSETQSSYEGSVLANVFPAEVMQQPTATPYHSEEASKRGLIVLMASEVLCQSVYTGRQQGDLQSGRACVFFVCPILFDYGLFFRLVQSRLLGSSPYFFLSLVLTGEIVARLAGASQTDFASLTNDSCLCSVGPKVTKQQW